jgi:hypothetical protein
MESSFSAAAGGAAIDAERLAGILALRIAIAPTGCEQADVARDIHPLVSHRLPPEAWLAQLDELVAGLIAAGHLEAHGRYLVASAAGRQAAQRFLGARSLPSSWNEARETALVIKALSLDKEPARRLKLLAKPDGLRALIVYSRFSLKVRGALSPSRLRAALALIALERAFGNQIKHGLGEKPGLAAKSGRLLAAQLARKPKDYGTDARLVAVLAAEAVEAPRSDATSLRLAVLRQFVAPSPGTERAASKPSRARSARKAPASAARPPAQASGSAVAAPPIVPQRPDPASFARAASALAGVHAEGWPGNRKAFISRVWETARQRHPEWMLSEIEFKCMLTEAHRAGLISLASADLKDKRSLAELQASAISYKNTVWHFIRVDD